MIVVGVLDGALRGFWRIEVLRAAVVRPDARLGTDQSRFSQPPRGVRLEVGEDLFRRRDSGNDHVHVIRPDVQRSHRPSAMAADFANGFNDDGTRTLVEHNWRMLQRASLGVFPLAVGAEQRLAPHVVLAIDGAFFPPVEPGSVRVERDEVREERHGGERTKPCLDEPCLDEPGA